MEKMKKFFTVLKSILTWFMLLTYPIFLVYLMAIFGYTIMMASMTVPYPN